MLRASVKQFSLACTMLFTLSADRSNSQSDFCGKGPLFLERVTYVLHGVGIAGVAVQSSGGSDMSGVRM